MLVYAYICFIPEHTQACQTSLLRPPPTSLAKLVQACLTSLAKLVGGETSLSDKLVYACLTSLSEVGELGDLVRQA